MNRVRIVNGTYHDLLTNAGLLHRTEAELDNLVTPALTAEEAARIAEAAMNQEVIGGCLSDPQGLVSDAVGRFTEVPGAFSQRAKDLCRNHQVEDAKFSIPGKADFDIIIVLHPKKDIVMGPDGTEIKVDHYVVFAREYGGNGEATMVPGNCYRCNTAEKQHKQVTTHDCFRRKHFPNMVPVLFAKAHGIDDAEDMAKELRSAWSAEAEQDSQGWDSHEFSFSNDYIAGFLAARPNAWSTLSQ